MRAKFVIGVPARRYKISLWFAICTVKNQNEKGLKFKEIKQPI
jgi:hypothetical protein